MGNGPGALTVYYPDFIDLVDFDETNPVDLEEPVPGDVKGEKPTTTRYRWYLDLLVNYQGIYVEEPRDRRLLFKNERKALTRHPTGNYEEPILPFPCTLGQLQEFVETRGLSDCIDPEALADWKAEHSESSSVTDAQVQAQVATKSGRKVNEIRDKLTEIVSALMSYAEGSEQPFDPKAMPGPLGKDWKDEGSFHWLCAQIDREFKKSQAMFEKYRVGICAIQRYAVPTDFYSRALPHVARSLKPEKRHNGP